MCGLVGLYLIDTTKQLIANHAIHKMTATLAHRGPDESGIHIFPYAALGNRRLKIIDLQSGQQPMCNETQKIWVTFNGEIYNYQTLRERLIRQGHLFVSQSDTEVIVHGYEESKEQVILEFDGQFAIAVYDEAKHRLLLARDRLGIKPLYYAVRQGHLIFGSEVKAILAHPLVKAEFNPRALTSYLSYRYPLAQESWYKDIFMLKPGELLIAENGSIHCETYWELPIVNTELQDRDERELVLEIRELLKQSVRQRMISDVPVGAYLSGGLDSSIVVALMAQHSSLPVKTFTIGFEEDNFNEFSYARRVSEHYATDHHEITLPRADYVDLLPKLISYKDAPLSVPNEIPLYVMSKMLKQYITVVLSGEGADELFGGYGRIFRSPYDFERMQVPSRKNLDLDQQSVLEANLRDLYPHMPIENLHDHFLFLYTYTPFALQYKLFSSEFMESLAYDVGLQKFWRTQFSKISELTPYNQYKWLFQKLHLVGLLLRVDMTTMATSVEGRVPFVDHHLVEYVLKEIPFEYLIRWRSPEHQQRSVTLTSSQISENYDIPKYVLRKAFQNDLPQAILERPKMGFPVPLDQWLGGNFGDFARDILLDRHTRDRGILCQDTLEQWLNGEGLSAKRPGQIIWMLVNLELWFRKYMDGV